MSNNGTQDNSFLLISPGDRVIVMRGAWAGYSGEYAGKEPTLIGEFGKVNLDNGMSTLVPLSQIMRTGRKQETS